MAFYDDEAGQDSSGPIELYKIVTPIQSYYYTSGPSNYTFLTHTYTKQAIVRTSIKVGTLEDREELTVEVPVTLALIELLSFTVAPPDNTFTLYRVHPDTGSYEIIWSGKISGVTIRGMRAQLRVPSILADALQSPVPPRSYQRLCNHQLYDSRCGIVRTDWDFTGTVQGVNENIVTITHATGGPSDTGQGEYKYRRGEIVRNADGERRLIINQAAASGSSARVLTINYPFRTLNAGDSVTLYAGCDLAATTCKNKFDNIVNFSGFPTIPRTNFWTNFTGIKGESNE